MKEAILFLFCFLFALIRAADVLELTPSNFDKEVGGDQPALVEFFAPWCGHCKSLAPEYEKAATAFAKLPVKVASVDADQHKDLGSRFGVSGFPTLKYFPAGAKEGEAYNGGRTAKDIVEFLNSKTGFNARIKEAPTAVTVLTDKNFDEIVKDPKKSVLVEFYAPWCGHCKKLAPDYEKVASIFAGESDVVIAKLDATEEKAPAAEFGITGYPTIKWFPKDDKSGQNYDGERSIEAFVNFINEKTGSQRTKDGSFLPTAGRIPELDELVTKFNDASNKKSLVAEFEAAANKVEGSNKDFAKFYVIAAKRIAEKGVSFATSESSRLQRLIESGSVTPDKYAEFAKRLNIINLFK